MWGPATSHPIQNHHPPTPIIIHQHQNWFSFTQACLTHHHSSSPTITHLHIYHPPCQDWFIISLPNPDWTSPASRRLRSAWPRVTESLCVASRIMFNLCSRSSKRFWTQLQYHPTRSEWSVHLQCSTASVHYATCQYIQLLPSRNMPNKTILSWFSSVINQAVSLHPTPQQEWEHMWKSIPSSGLQGSSIRASISIQCAKHPVCMKKKGAWSRYFSGTYMWQVSEDLLQSGHTLTSHRHAACSIWISPNTFQVSHLQQGISAQEQSLVPHEAQCLHEGFNQPGEKPLSCLYLCMNWTFFVFRKHSEIFGFGALFHIQASPQKTGSLVWQSCHIWICWMVTYVHMRFCSFYVLGGSLCYLLNFQP